MDKKATPTLWKDKQAILLLAVVLAAGLAISLYLYAGPMPFYDDVYYLNCAHSLITGNFTFIDNPFCYSFLNIAPTALSTYLLGNGGVQAVLPDIVEYALLVLVTFFVAYKLYGRYFASAGTLIVATAPFLVSYVTRVLSDISIGLIIAVSIAVFLLSIKRKSPKLSLVAGLVASISIYMKIDGFFYIVLFIIAEFIAYRKAFSVNAGRDRRRNIKHERSIDTKNLIAAIAGVAIGLILYFLAFYLVMHNPFYPLKNFVTNPSSFGPFDELSTLLSPVTLGKIYIEEAYQLYPLGPIAVLAVIGSVIGLLKRNGPINYISFFNWAMFAYLIFGTSSLRGYITVPVVSRFFDLNVMMLGVLGGYALFCLYGMLGDTTKHALFLKAGFLVFLVLVEISYLPLYNGTALYNSYSIELSKEIYSEVSYIKSHPISDVTHVYINAYGGTQLLGLLFEEFAFNYSKGFELNSTDYNNEIPSDNPSMTCSEETADSGAYLVVMGTQKDSYFANTQKEFLANWLGKNCTISPIEKIVYGAGQMAVPYIYKIN